MASYRCYILNTENRIQQAQDIEAECDADALIRAEGVVKTSAEHPMIEIWQGKRIVGRLTISSEAT